MITLDTTSNFERRKEKKIELQMEASGIYRKSALFIASKRVVLTKTPVRQRLLVVQQNMSVSGSKYRRNSAIHISDTRDVKDDTNRMAPVIILVLVQVILATADLIENGVLLLLEDGRYIDPHAKVGILFMAAVTSIWFLSCCLVFVGIYYRKCAFLIPHFVASIAQILVQLIVFISIVQLSNTWFPLFRLVFAILIILTTFFYEISCYSAIKLHNVL
uniref:Transmembrane protein 138 n=1 Tax=Panagrellus redivivus TaxID=6233 RepID=A0A7E4W5M9_PANRE